MPRDLFQGLKDHIIFDLDARRVYESQVVSRRRVLDIGGRNAESISASNINTLKKDVESTVICTDILPEYKPDLVDDICQTAVKPETFDGVYCVAILEHVKEYWKAIDNIHEILKPGGEAFFYVPFFYPFHDEMDHHRFTFAEVARMLEQFSEIKLLLPGPDSGYGYVFWYLNTLAAIRKAPRLHTFLTRLFNAALKVVLYPVYRLNPRSYTFSEFCFFYTHLAVNHGFCAWVKK